jgi:hypothetical protein
VKIAVQCPVWVDRNSIAMSASRPFFHHHFHAI